MGSFRRETFKENNSYSVSFISRELELARQWDTYCSENCITRSSAIKRLIKKELKEQLLPI